MDGSIYKITNKVNGKVYVGQTIRPIRARFKQHLCDVKKYHGTNRIKLYSAIEKYGKDNFECQLIETCNRENLNEREMYWIEKLDSCRNGYNTTLGGGGRLIPDPPIVMELWNQGLIVQEIKAKTGHSQEYIIDALERHGISKKERNKRARESQAKKVKTRVYQYDLDGNYVNEYASIWDAEIETGIHHSCINGVLCNKHITAGNYQWKRHKAEKIDAAIRSLDPSPKQVHRYLLSGEYIDSFASFTEAAKAVGLKDIFSIRKACKDPWRISRGYRWSLEKVNTLPCLEPKKGESNE